MKILISGSTGFIGKHLIKRLKKNNDNIHAIVRESTDTKLLKDEGIKYYVFKNDINNLVSFLELEKFDGIIHLASIFLPQHNPEGIKRLVDSNIYFATTLLESAVKTNVSWFINTGTFWQHYHDADYSPVNLYAATKQAFEDIAKYYIETTNIDFVTVKLNDTFGPNDTRPKIFNLWEKIRKSGERLDMSPGQQIIDISYIDNIVDGYLRLVDLLSKDTERKLSGKSFAIGSDQRMSLRKLAATYESVTKSKLNINWGGREYRPREVMIPWTKGKKIPGWKPNISISEGIRLMYQNKLS